MTKQLKRHKFEWPRLNYFCKFLVPPGKVQPFWSNLKLAKVNTGYCFKKSSGAGFKRDTYVGTAYNFFSFLSHNLGNSGERTSSNIFGEKNNLVCKLQQEKMNEISPFTHCAMQMNTSSSLELMLSTRFSVTVTRVLSKTCAASLLFSWRMLISFWMPRCSARGRIESRTWTMLLTATQIFEKYKKIIKN